MIDSTTAVNLVEHIERYFCINSFKGPPITSTSEQKAHLNGSEMATGPFIMKTPLLSTYSQQLWVIAKLSTSNNDGTTSDHLN